MGRVVDTCVVVFVVLLVVWLGAGLYASAKSPKMTLVKSDWECTETKTSTTYAWIGKVYVPTITTVCVEYKRN